MEANLVGATGADFKSVGIMRLFAPATCNAALTDIFTDAHLVVDSDKAKSTENHICAVVFKELLLMRLQIGAQQSAATSGGKKTRHKGKGIKLCE